MKSIYSCLIFNLFILSINGTIHYTDPTTEEIEYTDWAAGVRVIFCITDNLSIQEIDYAFKQAIVNVINLHCRNSTACGLEKRVKFVAHNILLLNGYPRRENRHYVFRFLIVLPLNSIPLEKLEKPLLHKRFSSSAFQNHIEDELTKKLGWKILSFESYPKYDEITVFMNSYLWLLGTIPCFLLAILGIFSAKLSSFEFGGGGDMIASGSKGGGKNTALTRTMEIIKNQQSFFDDIIKKQNIPDVGSDKENKYFENVKRGTKTTSTAPTGTYQGNDKVDNINISNDVIPSKHKTSAESILTPEQEAERLAYFTAIYNKSIQAKRHSSIGDVKEIKKFRKHQIPRNSIFSANAGRRRSSAQIGITKRWVGTSMVLGFMRKSNT